MLAGALITIGALGDRIGRRKLLLIGAAAFGAASTLAAFSTSAPMLIATRALLGLAGAALVPRRCRCCARCSKTTGERTRAIGVWGASFAVGAAIGPLVGGVAARALLVGLGIPGRRAVMVLLLIAGPLLLPEYRDPAAGAPTSLSGCSRSRRLLADLWPEAGRSGRPDLATACLDAPSASVWRAVFIRRQQTLADPMLDLVLFRNRPSTSSLATTC